MSILDEAYRVAWGDLVYMKGNMVEVLLSSLVGPLLYLLAFGFGVGGSMDDPQAYVMYIVPGIVALTTLSATFSTVSMKILVQRMFYMSFDEMLLCPLHISSIILGKTVQGMLRALISCTILLIVGWLLSPQVVISPWIFVVIILAGLMFSLLGMLAGMLAKKTQSLSLFSSVVVIPMTFLCGTLFDSNTLPTAAAYVIYALPLTHVSNLMRGIMLPDYSVGMDSIVIMTAYIVVLYLVCYYMIKNNKC
ncbi:MAG: ABC transporter permease [Candidatus Methanomethylophilaceae archaeon]|jgi:ABC-type polysaccharide/polyol phosphate export permease|nr:ABC transporter permease [Candidatus Methanomethylophilaceae archaeon]MBR6213171.1 ABC transporter permease [Candidatus Methanomethylophilaceae archaeon]